MSDTKTKLTETTNTVLPPPPKQSDSREELRRELAEKLEKKLTQTLLDIKASPEKEREARERMHQRLGDITLLSHNVFSDISFKQDVEQIIARTIEEIKHEPGEKKEHDKNEHGGGTHRHEPEKPEKSEKREPTKEDTRTPVQKMQEAISKGVSSGSPEQAAAQTNKTNTPLVTKQIDDKKPDKLNQFSGKTKPLTSPSALPKSKAVTTLISAIEKNKMAQEKKQRDMFTPAVKAFNPPVTKRPVKLGANPLESSDDATLQVRQGGLPQPGKNPTILRAKALAHAQISSSISQLPKSTRKPLPVVAPASVNTEEPLYNDVNDRGLAVVGNPDTEQEVYVREYLSVPINTGGEIIEQDQETRDTILPGQTSRAQDDENQASSAQANKKKREHALMNRLENKLEKEGAEFIAKQGAGALLRQLLPYILVALVILYLLLVIIRIITQEGEDEKQKQQQSNIPVTLHKTGPATGTVGQNLTYTINAGYAAQADNVQIVDTLPANVSYVSSSPQGTYVFATRTLTWDAKDLNIVLNNPFDWTVYVTVKALQNNQLIVNRATANVVPAQPIASNSGSLSQGYVAPTTDKCNGKYTFNTPLGKNFGDPTCNFTKNMLAQLIKTQDPTHLYDWYNIIVPHESLPPYNPNSYASPAIGTPDAAGAWGLYQMGSSNPPGKTPPAPGKNGQYDRGDVNWEEQTSNAIKYNNNLIKMDCIFWYWSTARNAGIAHKC